ncbi:MAG: hypothetical protein JSV26_08840 [bacterium]|nr:MAG: hypothetical protein JSV26_08840 [bacterium]
MGRTGRLLASLAAGMTLVAGCVTTMNSDPNRVRLDDHQSRIERLERAQKSSPQASGDVQSRLTFLENEIKAVRKAFADSQVTIDGLVERVESLQALLNESDTNLSRLRKRGVEVDRALEDLANRIEAEVRELADRIKKMGGQ